jgi:hypothetical protein
MSPEISETMQAAEYPVNLFEEPHDHANQWDVSVLWPDQQPSGSNVEQAALPVESE